LYSKFKIKKMDDEEVYVADDVLEEASAARYQMFNQNYVIRKDWKKLGVKENQ
jgi:hypothetical protein